FDGGLFPIAGLDRGSRNRVRCPSIQILQLPLQPKRIGEIQAGALGLRYKTCGTFRLQFTGKQIMPDAIGRVGLHKRLEPFPADVFQGRDLEKMLDDERLVHRHRFYQLEKSLLNISSVMLLTTVGISCASASVMVIEAEKSKLRDTSASKSAGATFFPVGSRWFLKMICTVTVSRLLAACWLATPAVV